MKSMSCQFLAQSQIIIAALLGKVPVHRIASGRPDFLLCSKEQDQKAQTKASLREGGKQI